MNKFLTMLFAIMLVLSGCLGGEDVSGNEEPQPVLLDTDGDGIPDVEDEDDDGDSWSDIDELNCDSDSLLASSVPADANGDGICDIRDLDDDGDSFADAVENQCGSDPLDATSVPADLDADGTCDALDDDIDGDGVANADDFAPEDPEKSEGVSGCTDATAFNYDEAAEVDDASCFTLTDAEEAVEAAMAGIASMEATELSDDMIIQTTLTMDEANGKSRLSIAMLGDDLEPIYQATYVDDGTGFVGVELYLTPDEGGLSPITEQYKVNGAYYILDMDDDSGWSHCEYDGTDWYCTDIFMMGEMVYNSDSETDTYHLYTCADGDTVLLSQVNDGTEDCADASDEPNVQSDGSMYMCDDGSTIDFHLANDGSKPTALTARTKTTSLTNSHALTARSCLDITSTTVTKIAQTAQTSPNTTWTNTRRPLTPVRMEQPCRSVMSMTTLRIVQMERTRIHPTATSLNCLSLYVAEKVIGTIRKTTLMQK